HSTRDVASCQAPRNVQYYLNISRRVLVVHHSNVTTACSPTPARTRTMPTLLDFAFLFILVVLTSIFEYYVFWPRFKAETTAGRPGARVRGYRRTIVGQVGFV